MRDRTGQPTPTRQSTEPAADLAVTIYLDRGSFYCAEALRTRYSEVRSHPPDPAVSQVQAA